jgi:hypothetical protein
MESSKKLMEKQIEEGARIYNNGHKVKAAEEYFKDHPDWYPEYCRESTCPVGARVVDTEQ